MFPRLVDLASSLIEAVNLHRIGVWSPVYEAMESPEPFGEASRIHHMGGCQNYGPFLGPYYKTAPIISGTQKGTLILTTTHISP